ncbi:hypothetical protein [Gracilibacillus alcaliphilus]|uniref:hypothetical protein n=1 Tax=Gracilibacillus alcaliphilus TaxID=1401441 RepID=UPI001958EC8F|nr:hypothetical protein [Gracilibacillus alcaliphilus]MBM7679544.1 hypothetical protein [Gracilibacillus alcaliphilus]
MDERLIDQMVEDICHDKIEARELVINYLDLKDENKKLQVKLNTKIMLVNQGDSEEKYVLLERVIELEQENQRYKDTINKAIAHFNQDEYIDGMHILRKAVFKE